MDELQRLRKRHDALPDPTEETIADARSRLKDHMRRPVPGKKRTWHPAWGLSLAGAATAAVLLVPLVLLGPLAGGGGTDEDRPREQSSAQMRAVAGAQDLAHNAAITAATERDVMPKPHQWSYLKELNAETKVDGARLRGTPKETSAGEVWSRFDDWGYADFRDGKLSLNKGSERTVDYRDIFSLPKNPDQLLAQVYKTVGKYASRPTLGPSGSKGGPLNDEDQDYDLNAFWHIEACLRDSALPTGLRAALVGALAKIPDVRYGARAVDLAKRPGITLYRIRGGYLREEILIDPTTYAYLGHRDIVVKDLTEDGEDLRKGDIMSWSSLVKAVVVDQPGRRS
ncbi:CU044_5270 family protein [Actinomadura xylanilytica]|uniref:CU044_5270 family protein n=1 Tax=Actinomadura xylanilytica TaxID=887459 RepID=UPI00255AB611|nr:CU044_5270 family protein [Actinomadura xylanilytica]MDL4773886.1 CU044_5270 family protein [Actinomadura xylanilytica]